ncbi:MAG: hypothetical protein ABI461_08670, partial [Polyangiaceae bacterium]
MRRKAKYAAIIAVFCAVPACSLFVSLDDLSGAPGSDASFDAGTDTQVEGSPSAESGSGDASATDAGSDSGSTTFTDDFNRDDNELIGNGWIEKAPAAYSLKGNAVVRSTPEAGVDFADNLVYRPAAQDVRDVALSVEFAYNAT